MLRPVVKLATSQSQVRRPTTTLPSHPKIEYSKEVLKLKVTETIYKKCTRELSNDRAYVGLYSQMAMLQR